MMSRYLCVSMMMLVVGLATPSWAQLPPKAGPAPGAAKMIVGTWRMVGAQTQAVDGTGPTTYPRGVKPSGYIIYDADGMMYVQIMDSDETRPPRTGAGPMSVEDQAKAFSSYTAYFGRYTIDEVEGSVVHHVAGNTNPRTVGAGQKRFLAITPDRLELNTFAKGQDGVERITRRMWERVK
jgi:hypothetical protein